jgi:hypothetical protein
MRNGKLKRKICGSDGTKVLWRESWGMLCYHPQLEMSICLFYVWHIESGMSVFSILLKTEKIVPTERLSVDRISSETREPIKCHSGSDNM